jgi:hypothetical protein
MSYKHRAHKHRNGGKYICKLKYIYVMQAHRAHGDWNNDAIQTHTYSAQLSNVLSTIQHA